MIHELKMPDSDNPDNVLESAKGKLKSVIIIGETTDERRYYASTTSFKPIILWMTVEFIFSVFGGE